MKDEIVIVGGGIAGVSIAEFLARHHGDKLSIQLFEQNSKLGLGASGKLEGWYHTGALYSAHQDQRTFDHCVSSLAHLLNHYSTYFPDSCNMKLAEKSSSSAESSVILKPAVTDVSDASRAWFDSNPIYLIHPVGSKCPEATANGEDAVGCVEIGEKIEQQRRRVVNRLEHIYGDALSWEKSVNGKVCFPVGEINTQRDNLETSTVISSNCEIDEMLVNFDVSSGATERSEFAVIKSPDCVMNTASILRDLVASALVNGVRFFINTEVEMSTDEIPGRITISFSSNGFQTRTRPRLVIFAVGDGFVKLFPDLKSQGILKLSRSAMIVADPPLTEIQFVRMSLNNCFHFNHILQKKVLLNASSSPEGEVEEQQAAGTSSSSSVGYVSLLANSGYVPGETEEAADVLSILESAEKYFGKEALSSRALFAYDCTKTEFVSSEGGEQRNYTHSISMNGEGNVMCVVPGKFSFFPVLAVEALNKIEDILNLTRESSSPHEVFSCDEGHLEVAQHLVADAFPTCVISNEYLIQ